MKKNKTNRGFGLIEFTDRYGEKCSLQNSSSATEDCIWLGVNEIQPKIMVSDAIKAGLDVGDRDCGWMDLDVPKQVQLSARMHLTREMVKELLPHLQDFVNNGEI